MDSKKEELLARFRRVKERKKASVEKTKQMLAAEYIKMFLRCKTHYILNSLDVKSYINLL